ncbi:MAG: hypothetical protein GF315_01810 [candidate division Zixibacteria bacterium]|nr:hypothetical protein [candidate division Zixibacteria bacterium]
MKHVFYGDWNLIKSGSFSGKFNMDVDCSLLEQLKSGNGRPTLRFFRWKTPTISYGINQHRIERIIDFDRCRESKIEVVQRPTGGRELLHGYDLSYSVVSHIGTDGHSYSGVRGRCKLIHQAIIAGLIKYGLRADKFPVVSKLSHNYDLESVKPCFYSLTGDEISYDGYKLVGSAQRCESHVFLQHGSIQLYYGTSGIVNYLKMSDSGKRKRLKDLMDNSVTSIDRIKEVSGVSKMIDVKEIENSIASSFTEFFEITFKERSIADIKSENTVQQII